MATLQQRADDMAGNYLKFQSFGWTAPEGEWTVHYLYNRDSDTLDLSNGIVLATELGRDEFGDDVLFERHGHWAVGWLEAVVVRVRDDAGNITPAFAKLHELMGRLEEYPILDEDAYSEMEADELANDFADCVESVGREYNEPVDSKTVRLVDEWVQANDPNVYYEEGWRNKEAAIRRAFDALGFTRD